MSAEVFFTDLRCKHGFNLLDKVALLFQRAGFADLIAERDLVALKLHFGEAGNTAYIRPQYLRCLVDKVKDAGGKPFLTDANTLYVGSRSNAVDHLQTAVTNGFAHAVVGAPLMIADGLNGKDFVNVPVDGKHFREVKIASAAYHADVMLAVSHFKGHEITGFGGTLKNIGMGLGCRSGKQMMHSDVLPRVDEEKCVGCGRCAKWCPAGAIAVEEGAAVIDHKKCIGCGECTVTCNHRAIGISWKTEPDAIQEKIAEYALGAIQDKRDKVGFINFVWDVTPECDCVSYNDLPVVRDVGILASKDPVALDQASLDLVNLSPVMPGSRLAEEESVKDCFRSLWKVDPEIQLIHGERIGLGTRSYNLVKVGEIKE